MARVATDQCTLSVEVGNSIRKMKVKDGLKRSGKATMVSSDRIVEEDAMKSDNEASEEGNENVTMHRAEKMTDRGMCDGTERDLKKRKRNNVKDDALSRCENKRERKKRKKDKRDCTVLSVDKETIEKKKKKKIEKDNAVDLVVTQSKEKKRKRKDMKGDLVKSDGDENALMDDIEEMEKERKAEKKKRKKEKREQKMLLNGGEMEKERKAEKKKRKEEKREQKMFLNSEGMEKERKAEKKRWKKDKSDCMVLLGDEETEVQKKKSTKKKERDDVKVAGIEEKRVERKTKKMRDDMKTRNREKKRERKDIEFEDDVVADLEEQNKLQHENKKSFSPSDSLKSLIDNVGGLIQGKRFTEEENELVKKAVLEYIEVKKLGKEGLDMVLECKSGALVRGCWQEIGRALPWRPYRSVYQRARRLFIRGDSKWTAEDVEHIRKSYEKYGPKWKKMADELGKYHCHVRNAFQRYQFGNLKKGKWSQHEYQTLFELVNKDLQINLLTEKKSCHGMLRDNIKWETISWKLGTRHNMACCLKWYKQLTSPMVVDGVWADSDDYKLLMVLDEFDASCEEEVEWDNLLEYRSGEACRKRWLQMMRHIGEHGNKTFSEQVEILSKRYCPDLAELREALDARPIVD